MSSDNWQHEATRLPSVLHTERRRFKSCIALILKKIDRLSTVKIIYARSAKLVIVVTLLLRIAML